MNYDNYRSIAELKELKWSNINEDKCAMQESIIMNKGLDNYSGA